MLMHNTNTLTSLGSFDLLTQQFIRFNVSFLTPLIDLMSGCFVTLSPKQDLKVTYHNVKNYTKFMFINDARTASKNVVSVPFSFTLAGFLH